MAQDQSKRLLRQGITAAKEGRGTEALDLLRQAVRLDPSSETAWLWLSSVAPNDRERVFCLKQVLAINPHNEFAMKGLIALGYEPQRAAEPAPGSTVPVLSDEKYARLQPLLDEVLAMAGTQPTASEANVWVRKTRRRYGESTAERLRQVTYAALILVVVGVTASAALLAQSFGVFGAGNSSDSVVYRPVLTPTPTPTWTPTPGFGPSPTPFPNRLSVGATAVPVGFGPAGSIYGIATPTPIYPAFDSSVERRIKPAIDLYSIGRYTEARAEFEAAQASYAPQCYPALVYYHAMSYARQGGTANLSAAARLLEDGLAYTPPEGRYRGEGYDSCPDAPLLHAGLAEVRLMQGRASQAYSASQKALEGDPGLVSASLVKAEVEQSQGDVEAAIQTLEEALARHPRDTRLLIRLGEIELEQGRANAALEYAGKALYVDPLLLPALRLQTAAYLALASGPDGISDTARMEYYGLAAHSAETLLLYYPGHAEGYLLLAEARMGEGKLELAEMALDRLLAVEDEDFRQVYADVTRRAYQLRGELYFRQGRYELAERDLRLVSQMAPSSPPVEVADRLLALDLGARMYDDASRQIGFLAGRSGAASSEYRLTQAKLWVEYCGYSALDDLGCDYARALNLLGDAFIEQLPAASQAEAYSLRAQAKYWTEKQRDLPAEASRANYESALEDLDQARARRSAPIDHYYRGLVLLELGELNQALAELLWVRYWHDVYAYPFLPDDFDAQVSALETRATEALALVAQGAGGRTPATRQAAPAPSPTPTPLPPEDRPQLP